MTKIPKHIIKEFNKTRITRRYLCAAPFVSLKISMDGRVSPCCYNKTMDEQYFAKSLEDIWTGDVFETYRKNIKNKTLPPACINCEKSLRNREYQSVKIHQYDKYKIPKFRKPKPRVIEMALSNICNLECIMCSGRYSSAIRKNKEKLPPLKSEFGDSFRTELQEYIQGLQEAIFAGGEPFLIPLYYKIWEDIIRINPSCEISIVTNGTILNNRIKDILERGNFKIILSFDSVDKENYEKIRKNASFENTLKNMDYFDNYLKQRGKRLHIPICPLKENKFEIPDIVRFCNERKYSLNFVTVTAAFSHAMWALGSEDLKQLKAYYLKQNFKCENNISSLNIQEFNDLINRIDDWIKDAIVRENFESKFDLTQSKVEILKRTFFANIKKSLRKVCNDEEDFNNKWHSIINNFTALMNELPDYFESNHFYNLLNTVSPSAITYALINYHVSALVENSMEMFFNSKL